MTDHLFRTVQSVSQGQYREKGSRFECTLFPCHSLDELKELVVHSKKSHPGAVHHCFAAVIGIFEPVHRHSDAGEPKGSAGLPMLNQLLSARLVNTGAIVVRYFGGTLLGKPGLISAYKSAVVDAIQHARIEDVVDRVHFRIRCPLHRSDLIQKKILAIPNCIINSRAFAETCELDGEVPRNAIDNILPLSTHFPDVQIILSA